MDDTTKQTNGQADQPTMQIIDDRLKDGDWSDELERALLIADREKLYLATGMKPIDFTKDTSEKTGISRSVIQRLRRVARLPSEVRQVLAGTKIADRQDLLVDLSIKIEGKPVEEAVEMTRDLIVSPPKYGPRTTPKTAPTAVELAPEPGITILEGLPIAMTFPDGEPRIQDLELGRRLGYTRPRDIRHVVKELVAGGHLTLAELHGPRGAAPRRSTSASGEHWFTEEQAIFVTTQAGTPVARTITRQVVRAFVAARHALNKPVLDDKLLDAINQTMGFHGSVMTSALGHIEKRLVALENIGFGMRPMLLIPQVDPEDAGYSMEAMNKALIEKGYSISENDTAIRSIAVKLKLIGDVTYGFWNTHSDRVNRSLSDSWRFNEAGAHVIQPYAHQYCELKAKYEANGVFAPRERALQEVLDTVSPIGTGEHTLLTRDRRARTRNPFPNIRVPELVDVVLANAGGNKIAVIKTIREITGIGLREAKDLMEAAPKTVKEQVSKADAEEMKKKLVEAGATVELR